VPSIMKTVKFPKFMAKIYSEGIDIKCFVQLLHNNGYRYSYSIVRKKLRGESMLSWEDIRIFAEVMKVSEAIFFEF